DNLAHELVTENVASVHGRHVAVVKMQIGAADRGRGHFDDGITRIENPRIGHVLDANFPDALPAHCSHCIRLPNVARPIKLRRPAGCPNVVATSPVSMSCLRRRRSSLICSFGSSPKSLASCTPSLPAGGM